MPFLTYLTKPAGQYAGMIADLRNRNVVSKVNTEASLAIDFGLGVVKGTDETNMKLPRQASLSGQRFIGVAVHDHRVLGEVIVGEMALIMVNGVIAVTVEDAVVYGQAVHMRVLASGANTTLGAFRGTGDPDDVDSTCTLNGARFESAASAGGIAWLRLSDDCTMTIDS